MDLQYLDLSFNQLTGEIPEDIGKLMNLRWLYLNDNQLTGEIPKDIARELIKLYEFKYHGNRLFK